MNQTGNKTKVFIIAMCVINIVLIGIVIGLIVTRDSDDDSSGGRRRTSSYTEEADNEGEKKASNDKTNEDEKKNDIVNTPVVSQNDDGDYYKALDRSKPQMVIAFYLNASYEWGKAETECLLLSNPQMLNKLELSTDLDSSLPNYEIVQCKTYSYSKSVTKGIKKYIEMYKGNASFVEESAIIEVKPTEYSADETPYRIYFTLCKIDNGWYILHTVSKEPDKINQIADYWDDMSYSHNKHDED